MRVGQAGRCQRSRSRPADPTRRLRRHPPRKRGERAPLLRNFGGGEARPQAKQHFAKLVSLGRATEDGQPQSVLHVAHLGRASVQLRALLLQRSDRLQNRF